MKDNLIREEILNSVSVFCVVHFSHGSGKRRRVVVSNNKALDEYMWLTLISLLMIRG